MDTARQLSTLVDIYLEQNIPKEMYVERKSYLDRRQTELEHERADVAAHLKIATISDTQIIEIEAFCAELREGLEYATFEDKQRCLDLLDVYGMVAVENDERVINITCRLGKQRVVLIPI